MYFEKTIVEKRGEDYWMRLPAKFVGLHKLEHGSTLFLIWAHFQLRVDVLKKFWIQRYNLEKTANPKVTVMLP